MRKVVDANVLRHPVLEAYLGNNPSNHVLFTDYACMESYKGKPLENIRRSLEIVSKYPNQVIVLKGTREIIRLQANGHKAPADLVDSEQTREFRDFCRLVRAAVQGDTDLRSQLLDRGKIANAHFDRMRDDASGVADAIRQMAQSFSPGQLTELRGTGELSKETGDVIVRNVLTLAALLFKGHSDVLNLPPAAELRGTFVFRVALANQLLVVRWLKAGGIESVSMDRLRNDVVDMTYVAYATLFDGIISNDRKLVDIHEETVFFLRNVFGSDSDQPIAN